MRRQFFAQHGPDDARVEQRCQGLEQVPNLKETHSHERIGRGQFNHMAGIPVEQVHTERSLSLGLRVAKIFTRCQHQLLLAQNDRIERGRPISRPYSLRLLLHAACLMHFVLIVAYP